MLLKLSAHSTPYYFYVCKTAVSSISDVPLPLCVFRLFFVCFMHFVVLKYQYCSLQLVTVFQFTEFPRDDSSAWRVSYPRHSHIWYVLPSVFSLFCYFSNCCRHTLKNVKLNTVFLSPVGTDFGFAFYRRFVEHEAGLKVWFSLPSAAEDCSRIKNKQRVLLNLFW